LCTDVALTADGNRCPRSRPQWPANRAAWGWRRVRWTSLPLRSARAQRAGAPRRPRSCGSAALAEDRKHAEFAIVEYPRDVGPNIAVAPPAGAVMTVTVFAFMPSRFGSVHVSSGLGTPQAGVCAVSNAALAALMAGGRTCTGTQRPASQRSKPVIDGNECSFVCGMDFRDRRCRRGRLSGHRRAAADRKAPSRLLVPGWTGQAAIEPGSLRVDQPRPASLCGRLEAGQPETRWSGQR
jgi:hypothetical protein